MQTAAMTIHHNLLYTIEKNNHQPETIRQILLDHPEVRFVSMAGIDLAGNDTDERIPIRLFLENIEGYLHGSVQTDGSSVVLPGIATLNDGKVDFIADLDVNWFVDYNYENINPMTGLPCGTLRIPAFLSHNGDLVCSRAVLRRACGHFDEQLKKLLTAYPRCGEIFGFEANDIESVSLTAATELEFWVRTPDHKIAREQLSVSQGLKEQYWKRTKGVVRTALEQAIELLELYGLEPEMGHKEVGGVKAHLTGTGDLDHIMEQLEIDWKYASAVQAADNELFARIFIKEVFRQHGLEASFMAKPIEGIAGSGEHIHVNAVAMLKNGRKVNLFAPENFDDDFLSPVGWGALMGFMKHYTVISPFISVSNDAFNRLKPGFEAPTHPVASLGVDLQTPSRNRTVLVGLIRSEASPLSTRFEVRSPNPHTNAYLALAALYQCMLNGIEHVLTNNRTSKDLEKEFCKQAGEPAEYLLEDRLYRSEDDVFMKYTEEQRDALFGKPPASVYQTLRLLLHEDEGLSILCKNGVFSDRIISSYSKAMLNIWEMELHDRLLQDNLIKVQACQAGHTISDYDEGLWNELDALRKRLAKDNYDQVCLFNEIRQALETKNLRQAARLQIEMDDLMRKLDLLYEQYLRNQLS